MKRGTLSFQKVLISSPEIMEFRLPGKLLNLWWRIVLLLHGKPDLNNLPVCENNLVLSNGFRFYAMLYRSLAFIILLVGIGLIYLGKGMKEPEWGACGAIALSFACYLFVVVVLGDAGANSWENGDYKTAIPWLILFFTALIAFLSVAVFFIAVIIYHYDNSQLISCYISCILLYLFGIGSYVIELVYIARYTRT